MALRVVQHRRRVKQALVVPPPAPIAENRGYSFTGWQVSNPAAPPPGDRMDAEYDRLSDTISRLIHWMKTVQARSADTANATSDAEYFAALAQDYADVTQAWAEHMPDTIPPNILAVMAVTGDHWSSRWWANQAATRFGSRQRVQTLLYMATANQTVFPLHAPDLGSRSYNFISTEPLEVYVAGDRVPEDAPNPGYGYWNLDRSTSILTFLQPLTAGVLVQIDVMQPDLIDLNGLYLRLIGGTMTGPLYLAADPTAPLGAATKRYVDNAVGTVATGFLPLSGGTLTGPLILAADPTTALGAVTRQYVDNRTFNEAPSDGMVYGRQGSTASWRGVLPLTGGTMTGPLNLTATGGSAVRSAQDHFGEVANVKDFGAKGDGVTDDGTALQAAANSLISKGGVLLFPYGVYAVGNMLSVPSNTLVEGNKSTLLRISGGANAHLLTNRNNGATTLTDHDIIVRELTFDYGSSGADGGAHAINFAFARNVSVEDCTFQCRGIAGDAVALIGCYDTSIEGCSAYGFTNCAYDHWWGPTNARVVNCYAETVASAQLVNFNPESTSLPGSWTAKGFVLEGCELVATGSAAIPSQLEPLGAGTSVSEVTVQGNIFRNAVVFFRGAVKDVIVANNVFDTPLGGSSVIDTQPAYGGNPINVVITGNLVSDPSTSSGGVAAILVWTSSAVISGNMVIGGSVSAIDTSSYTPVVIGNYNNTPTNTPNAIAQTAPMRLAYGLAFAGGDAGGTGDVSKHIRLAPDGSGINYQSNQVNMLTTGSVQFYVSGTRQGYVDGTGINGPLGQGARYPGLFTTLGCTGLFQGIAGLVSNVPNTSTPLLQNEYLGANVGGITTNGTTSSYNATSDYRLKTITGLADGSRIDALTVHEGYFTALPDEPQALLLAHEVADVLPHIVLGEKDAVDEEGQPIWQSMDFAKIVPDLVAKCQALERRLAALEGVGQTDRRG